MIIFLLLLFGFLNCLQCDFPTVGQYQVRYPLNTDFPGLPVTLGLACLVDKQEGLFVAAHGPSHFGALSHALVSPSVILETGCQLRCDTVATDWPHQVTLLRVVKEDRAKLTNLSEANLSARLFAPQEKMRLPSSFDGPIYGNIWQETKVVNAWVVPKSVQCALLRNTSSIVPGAPVVDNQGDVLGIVLASIKEGILVLHARHVLHVLDKWLRGCKPAPGYVGPPLSSTADAKSRPGRSLPSPSYNGLVPFSWKNSELAERQFWGRSDMSAIDARYQKGSGPSGSMHLYVDRQHANGLKEHENPVCVGDILLAVWDGSEEVPIHGDPVVLLRVLDKAYEQGHASVSFTVFRQNSTLKVQASLLKGVSASRGFYAQALMCSDEVLPYYRPGVFCIWQNRAVHVESLNRQAVKTVDDIWDFFAQSGSLDCVTAGYTVADSAYSSRIGTAWGGCNTYQREQYEFPIFAVQPSMFKKVKNVWTKEKS